MSTKTTEEQNSKKAQPVASDKPSKKGQAAKKEQSASASEPSQPGPIKRFMTYVEDSKAELRKVTWPTMLETRKATFAVLGFVAVMAVILGLVDLGLSSIIKIILS